MNKNLIIASLVIVSAIFIGLYLNNGSSFGSSDSTNVFFYKTATNATVVCSGATSTLLLAAPSQQGKRYSFEATVASTTNITICKKATGCVVGEGLTVNGSGGSFEQNDAYYGAYSCIGSGASSTVGITYFQN